MVVSRHQAALGIVAEAQNVAELVHHHAAQVAPADTVDIDDHQPADVDDGVGCSKRDVRIRILPAPLRRRPDRMTNYSALIDERMRQMDW